MKKFAVLVALLAIALFAYTNSDVRQWIDDVADDFRSSSNAGGSSGGGSSGGSTGGGKQSTPKPGTTPGKPKPGGTTDDAKYGGQLRVTDDGAENNNYPNAPYINCGQIDLNLTLGTYDNRQYNAYKWKLGAVSPGVQVSPSGGMMEAGQSQSVHITGSYSGARVSVAFVAVGGGSTVEYNCR
ncbi:hypothetical protein [Streptomyces sp. Tue6028]|uniref:hypothetical protein n=1 Tax=Streptomyces sp. Tue6028 TaxID=2036037 RepID=UPI003EB7929F